MLKRFGFIALITCISTGWGVWDGSHYQLTSRPQYEAAQFALSQLPKKVYNTVLDIGCGSGEITNELAENASLVLGVDYSESMILKAKETYGDRDNLTFQVEDICSLAGINQTFDLVIALHTLQWIESINQPKAFEQIVRVLAPGATCLLLTSDRHNIFYKPLMEVAKLPKWKQYMPEQCEPWNWQTVESVTDSFLQVGLQPLNVFVWYKKYHAHSKQEFFDFMANWFYNAAPFDYIPASKREELFNEVLETFLTSISYEGEGPVVFESPFVLGIAQKR